MFLLFSRQKPVVRSDLDYDLVHTDLSYTYSFLGLTYTGSQLSTSSRSLPPCTT